MSRLPTRNSPARRRSGSVLILVIALLVLIALIGTAYISVARVDRQSAAQSSTNVQHDLDLEGVANLVRTVVVNDLFDTTNSGAVPPIPPGYRRAFTGAGVPVRTDYLPFDDYNTDTWLADRVPVRPGGGGPIIWPHISGSLVSYADANKTTSGMFIQDPRDLVTAAAQDAVRTDATPALWPAAGPLPNGSRYLGLIVGGRTVIATDADGDGIPDARLFQVSTSPDAEGITYLAGIRVVDNNSAVNISTAWHHFGDFTTDTRPANSTTTSNPAYFTSSVGLMDFLRTYEGPGTNHSLEMDDINRFRLGYSDPFNTAFNSRLDLAAPYTDPYPQKITPPYAGAAVSAQIAPLARADFTFTTQQEAFYTQVGRRVDNPGYNRDPADTGYPAGAFFHTRDFSWSDSAALAYRFCLRNPATTTSLSSWSAAERLMPESLALFAWASPLSSPVPTGSQRETDKALLPATLYIPDQPYDPIHNPAAVNNWFTTHFDYFNENRTDSKTFRSRRPLVVARNPVTNVRPESRFRFIGNKDLTKAAVSMLFGEWVRDANTGYCYVCVNPVGGSIPIQAAPSPGYKHAPYIPPAASETAAPDVVLMHGWGDAPARANVNNASFEELYATFLELMIRPQLPGTAANFITPVETVAPDATALTGIDKNLGNVFASGTPYPSVGSSPYLMFRSPLRDPTPLGNGAGSGMLLPATEVAKLRSAIAAVNTLALRDPGSPATAGTTVPLRTLTLTAFNRNNATPRTLQVNVFGAGPQPYITEVVAKTEQGVNYVAVELFNPTSAAISTAGWEMAIVDKTNGTVYGDAAAVHYLTVPVPTVSIPAGGYIAFEGTGARPAYVVPTGTPTPFAGLDTAIDREIVFLKPLRYDGALTPGLDDVGNANRHRFMVPVDSFDLTGTTATISPNPHFGWHYVRTNDAALNRWQMVFPGRYDASKSGPLTPRQQGTEVWSYIPPAADVVGPTERPITLGAADPAWNPGGGIVPPATFPIQVGKYGDPAGSTTTGFPSENRVAAGANLYPFGMFARDGDMQQITFIGSYTIWDPTSAVTDTVMEFNPISMDASRGEDSDALDDTFTFDTGILACGEQIGRFYPAGDPTPGATVPRDFETLANGQLPTQQRYYWATRLYDYFTVNSPADDAFPSVNTQIYTAAVPASPPQRVANETNAFSWPSNDATPPEFAANYNESTIPVEGLININTAPARVLEMLPFSVPVNPADAATSSTALAENRAIADAIVAYRTGITNTTPFRSIADLVRVFEVRTKAGTINVANEPDDREGDFTPSGQGTTDGVRFDFEEVYAMVTRVSNMVTTRSDSFTVYVVVEGWQNAGTPNAKKVSEARKAFIIDRSRVTPTNRTVREVSVPTN